ncbi:hypothetical protein TNCV_2804401 [Trichonephila clavipes]|nr:hypothetical protein TNCV_2804401 [Trichonephila clavipes]
MKKKQVEEWVLLPQVLLDNLFLNMERRCEAITANEKQYKSLSRYYLRTNIEAYKLKPVKSKYIVYCERSEHDLQRVVLYYHVGRWRLARLEDRSQPLDLRCQKCTDMFSNDLRCKLEICVS